jgi:hypothetical protein
MKDDHEANEGRGARDDGGNEADLAEVIRLQAEALARISGRMSGHRTEREGRDIPPPGRGRSESGDVLLARRPAAHDDSLPVLGDDPALSADQMPVLNAFKKFLDMERRRTRRRMIEGGILVGLLLVGVLTAGFVLGRNRLAELSDRLREQRESSERARLDTETELRRVAWAAQELRTARSLADADLRRLQENAALLRHELTNQVLQARTQLVTEISRQSQDLERMKKMIASLESENVRLQTDLADIRTAPPVLPPTPVVTEPAAPVEEDEVDADFAAALRARGEELPAAPPAPLGLEPAPAPEAPLPGPRRTQTAGSREGSLPLVIAPSNLTRSVEFRLPLIP